MAERLEEYDFNRRRTDTLYPWEDWTDGTIWRIRAGDDFQGSLKNFQQRLYKEATRRGVKAQVSSPEEGVLVFRFLELTEEDMRRAEQRRLARERASSAQ